MKKYVLRSENGKKVDNSEVKFAKEENCNKEARERVPEGVPLEEIDPGENSKVAREERKMDETKIEHEENDPGENVKVGHEKLTREKKPKQNQQKRFWKKSAKRNSAIQEPIVK